MNLVKHLSFACLLLAQTTPALNASNISPKTPKKSRGIQNQAALDPIFKKYQKQEQSLNQQINTLTTYIEKLFTPQPEDIFTHMLRHARRHQIATAWIQNAYTLNNLLGHVFLQKEFVETKHILQIILQNVHFAQERHLLYKSNTKTNRSLLEGKAALLKKQEKARADLIEQQGQENVMLQQTLREIIETDSQRISTPTEE